ncbi:hypothetical protein RJ641_016610 [Dillenia turbinata]|uniref:Protein TILLER ANGLE CONTROL 1 n=1 Tax=Dillenia turbinata TaxID=194707 RepID=A0AAN8UJW4_9MAGN
MPGEGADQNVKKNIELVASDTDTQALLRNVAIVDVIEDWKDGILRIGTFGFDPLKSFNYQKNQCGHEGKDEYYEEEAEDHQEEEEDKEGEGYFVSEDEENEELNPLMYAAFNRGAEEKQSNYVTCVPKNGMLMTIDGVRLIPKEQEDIIIEEDQKKKRGKRVTLADLFSADSDSDFSLDSEFIKEVLSDSKESQHEVCDKKSEVIKKSNLSFAKKLIPRAGNDALPIKKLHRLVRRMLKRKIHPDIGSKTPKPDSEIKAAMNEFGCSESASLRQA